MSAQYLLPTGLGGRRSASHGARAGVGEALSWSRGVHMDPVMPVIVMFTSPAWQPAGWNGSSKWQRPLATERAPGAGRSQGAW